jgi:hypothetical protein
MQRSLLDPSNAAPSPVRGYAPVLQDHGGERDALAALRGNDPGRTTAITPVIQIVGGNKNPLTKEATRNRVKNIAIAVGKEWPFYLDFVRADPCRVLNTTWGDITTAEVAYRAARKRELPFVPVAWTHSRPAHLNAAANASIFDHRGLALRHRLLGAAQVAGQSTADRLKATLADLQVKAENIDLFLDLGYLDPDVEVSSRRLNRLVARCVDAAAWRRVVLVGGSMPSSLTVISEGGSGLIERREWALWRSLPADLRRRVEFGDYGVQNPVPPQGGGPGMRANIRYCLDEHHLVVRGVGDVTIEGAPQYVGLCERLLQSGSFAGRSYSWGDSVIEDCARGDLLPGGQNLWRGAGTSRHLQAVSAQVLAQG